MKHADLLAALADEAARFHARRAAADAAITARESRSAAGSEALSALFEAPAERDHQEQTAAPASAPPVPSGERDWTSTDAAIEAARAAATPTADPASAASSEPGTDAALLAMLNPAPEGETRP
ncbi:hypothetical protein GCM10022237_09010 [Nocardioides ginsengisoli]|uniref:Uncharacterized protein n=1 Tax=Nocardioides ginsengisoli TaxID=363868 RepID=A0ABW3W021_9ACTN